MEPVTLLTAAQTNTPDDDILKELWGEYHLLCTTYSSDVTLQVRAKGGTTWNTASYNGEDIELTAAGAIAEVRFNEAFEYRVQTTTAGSVVVMGLYTKKWNPNP